MKKLLCFLLCSILIFSSVSLCFATDISWNTTDSGHLTEIRNSLMSGGTIYNLINSCNTQLNNINYNLVTLMGWLDPSSGGGTTALLNQILNMLSYTDAGGVLKSFIADISFDVDGQTQYLLNLRDALTNISSNWSQITNAHAQLFADSNSNWYTVSNIWGDGNIGGRGLNWNDGTPIGNLAAIMQTNTQNQSLIYQYRWAADLSGYNTSQSYYDPLSLNTSTFTPTSMTNGIYTWLSKIQQPTARLAYVLASPERIAAQEAAADNEEAVVDNFIDSSGDGAASTSDIGSVSDLSSGYKQNFGSDASPSGIFDIFNSDHATWFSQETKNQLDTTTPSRMTKGSVSETPLLDKQIEDIYNALGVKQP